LNTESTATALGNARLTALVFLTLLAPLSKAGVDQLAQAQNICQKHGLDQLSF